ncbi:MAG: tetratricopeptide repeat protein [Chloroflexota bacterium]
MSDERKDSVAEEKQTQEIAAPETGRQVPQPRTEVETEAEVVESQTDVVEPTDTGGAKPLFSGEPFERFVALLIALVTIIAAIAGYLESDAGARSDTELRNAQQFALQAMGVRSRGEVQTGFAWTDGFRLWVEMDSLAFVAEESGELALANQYRAVRDDLVKLTPLLAEPYFDPEADEFPDINAYEADVYIVEATALSEQFANAATVSDAWDGKASAYVTHLTLLTVALFLFGLSTTIIGRMSWLFVGIGSLIGLVTLVWMVFTVLEPVPIVPDDAIEAYAAGVGLAFQEKNEAALQAFDQALTLAPDYANAFYERAKVHFANGNLAGAAVDYERALENGREDVNVPWNLGWTYYLLGEYEQAAEAAEAALEIAPNQAPLFFNLGLAHLASGDLEMADSTFRAGMETAVMLVSDARAAGEEAPATLWWYLDTAAYDMASLLNCLYDQVCENAPAYDNLADSDEVRTLAEQLNLDLRNLAVGLEYLGEPADGSVVAEVGDFEFAQAVLDESGQVVSYEPLPGQTAQLRFGTVFEDEGEAANITVTRNRESSVENLFVLFDYEGIPEDEVVVFKVYANGREATGLRLAEAWTLGDAGRATIPLTPRSGFALNPGDYKVEIYVGGQLTQQGGFTIGS